MKSTATPAPMDKARQAAPDAPVAPVRNVLIVGVGGQGVVMISQVLAQMCQRQGFEVKQSEVHGMAKRGGVVFSHVRFGAKVWAPTIPQGQANIVLALEWTEGLRWLSYLHPEHGTFIADTKRITSPFAFRNRKRGAAAAYNPEAVETIRGQLPNSLIFDATRAAEDMGNVRVANTILLGVLSSTLDFPEGEWLEVLSGFVPRTPVDLNRKAFLRGREWGAVAPGMESVAAEAPAGPAAGTNGQVVLDINAAWCKSCDICVKMCPERILFLNGNHVVEVTDVSACTGCRICEMLCPDFAITVRL